MKRTRYVFGDQFGPKFIAMPYPNPYHAPSLEGAIDEWDERFGARVTPEDESAEEFEKALNDGEIRINDGGTIVYVDPYEWMREYDSGRKILEDFGTRALRSCAVYVY